MADPKTCWHNVVEVITDTKSGRLWFCCVSCGTDAPEGAIDHRYDYDAENDRYISSGKTEW